VNGGSSKSKPPRLASGTGLILGGVAQRMGIVVALVSQVPNQPLFEGLSEDALIAYTFDQFLKTKDETWPCLLPMTKSAVRAMDAVTELAREKHSQKIESFFVTGGSKRGWTTWLAGAVDPRVRGIAPMVIDTLNMREQMPHQVRAFGEFSEEIRDYTELDLPRRMGEPAAARLLELVDPFSYRAKLSIPKLIVLGTNDRYWPVDAVKLYFDRLPGKKYLHSAPNVGHDLGARALEAANAVAAFFSAILEGAEHPRFSWKLHDGPQDVRLEVKADDLPRAVELWRSSAPTRDFRDARWTSSEVSGEEGVYRLAIERPAAGYAALFGRLLFESPLGVEYALTTNVEVIEGRSVGSPRAAGGAGGAGAK
jgi:PhoPQ-activated pathogenicity-related protein